MPKITREMLDRAAELAGVGPFTAEQKKMMLDGLNDQRDAYGKIRALKLANRRAAGVCVSSGAGGEARGEPVAYEGARPQLVFDDAESRRAEGAGEHRGPGVCYGA